MKLLKLPQNDDESIYIRFDKIKSFSTGRWGEGYWYVLFYLSGKHYHYAKFDEREDREAWLEYFLKSSTSLV